MPTSDFRFRSRVRFIFSLSALGACLTGHLAFHGEALGAQDAGGFPMKLPAVVSSPLAIGRDGQGSPRIYLTVGGSQLFCATANGQTCDGFPVFLGKGRGALGALATGDLNGDGADEVVLLDPGGALRTFAADGTPLMNQERAGQPRPSTPPSLADVNGDGRPEILFGDEDGRLVAVDASGDTLPGFPKKLASVATSRISFGFAGDDGKKALFWGDEEGRIHGVWLDAFAPLPGFPLETGYVVTAQPSLADFDGTGRLSLCVPSQDFKVYALHEDGVAPGSFPQDVGVRVKDGAAFARMDGSGALDCVVASPDGRIHAFGASGKPRKGFPAQVDGKLAGGPIAVDLDGDGIDEVMAASPSGKLHAVRQNGRNFPGFPARLKGMPDAGPAAVRLDGSVLVFQGAGETLHGFRIPSKPASGPLTWPMDGHDGARGGRVTPSAPHFSQLTLTPSEPVAGDPLKLTYRYRSMDGAGRPASVDVRWMRDGADMPAYAGMEALPAGVVRKGEKWQATIGLKDARVVGPAPSVLVRNSPPSPPRIHLRPEVPTSQSGASAVLDLPVEDPDGDKVSLEYRWTLDGVEIQSGKASSGAAKGAALPPGALKRGGELAVEVTAFDGKDRSVPSRTAVRVGNSPPPPPKAHLSTKAPKCGEDLKVIIDGQGADRDGDTVGHLVSVSVDGVPSPLSRGRLSIPTHGMKKGARVLVSIAAHDGMDEGEPVTLEAVVANCPPSRPVVIASPSNPKAGDTLAATVQAPVPDADGDAVSYSFSVAKGGAKAGAAEKATGLKKGERYVLVATASDGESETASAPLTVTIGNTPPDAPRIAWKAPVHSAGGDVEVRIAKDSRDVDGDKVSYRYRWSVNGGPASTVGESSPALKKGAFRKGDRVEVAVTPFDGTDEGTPSKLATGIANTPPTPPSIELEPSVPLPGQAIRAKVVRDGTDDDQDALSYRYRWLVDGFQLDLPPQTDALPAGLLRHGMQVEARVSSFDGETIGKEASAQTTVGKAPAATFQVRIDPVKPAFAHPLSCVHDAPPGSDIAYEWILNGKRLPLSPDAATIPGRTFPVGAKVQCAVTAIHQGRRDRAASAATTILATPPLAPRLVVEPAFPKSGDDLLCKVDVPPDDDGGLPLRYEFRWTADGKPLAANGADPARLPSENLRKGPVYACVAVAVNDAGRSPEARAEKKYANTPPGVPAVRLSPEAPTARDALECILDKEAQDVDGDRLGYRFVWWKDGKEQSLSPTTQRIPARMTKAGETWRCGVQAVDQEAQGPMQVSGDVSVSP